MASGGYRWPLAAAVLYAALIPFQPVITLPDGSPLRLAAADAVAPLVLLAALIRPRRRLPAALALLALAVPLLAYFTTLLAALDRSLSGYALGKTAGLFYLTAVCFALVRGLEAGAEPVLLRALAFGALWSAVVGLVGFAASTAGVETTLVKAGRLCSTMSGDPNIYCSLLAVGLIVVAGDRRRGMIGRIARGSILGVALLATGSRSGLAGLLVGLAVLVLVRSRERWVSAARSGYALGAAAVCAMLVLTTNTGWQSAHVLWQHLWRTFTVESRLGLYERALAQFGEHPLTGLGIGGFSDLNTWVTQGRFEHFAVHNTYLWAFVDMGIAGGLLVSGLIVAAIWRAARAAGDRSPPVAESASVVAAALAAMAIFNLFIDGFYQRHFWVLVACALAMPVRMPRRATVRAWGVRPEQPLVCSGAR